MYRSGQKVYFLFMFLCLENTEILFDYFLSFSFSFPCQLVSGRRHLRTKKNSFSIYNSLSQNEESRSVRAQASKQASNPHPYLHLHLSIQTGSNQLPSSSQTSPSISPPLSPFSLPSMQVQYVHTQPVLGTSNLRGLLSNKQFLSWIVVGIYVLYLCYFPKGKECESASERKRQRGRPGAVTRWKLG